MMIRNEIELNEVINDLTYEIMLIESELKNCENQQLGETLFNALVEKKIALAIINDTQELA